MPQAPWMILTWPRVVAVSRDPELLARQMQHLCTTVSTTKTSGGCVSGQTLFGCQVRDEHLGLAWDWTAVRGRVLALSDPMTILSNIHFVDDSGRSHEPQRRIVQLNDLVAYVPWQAQVVNAAAL